jgi:hypothetical protein
MKVQGAQQSQVLASVNPAPTSLVKNEIIEYVTLTDGLTYTCVKGSFGVYRTKSNESGGGPPFVRFVTNVEGLASIRKLTIETFLTSLVAVGYSAEDDEPAKLDDPDSDPAAATLAPPERYDG